MSSQPRSASPRFLVCAGMRNEGPFIVEWVSWYRMLGFEILVVTNDCADHSPELLAAFEDAGWLTHQPHTPEPNQPPKRSAYNAMRSHELMGQANWVLVCDADELLVLHDTNNIADYVAGFSPQPRGIAFHWRVFGTSGIERWTNRLKHRTFRQAADTKSSANARFKSMFRGPLDYARFSDHSPTNFLGTWDADTDVWVDCNGKPLRRMIPTERPQKATAPERVRHDRAQMNHYITRTEENFDLKRGVPSASAGADRYNDSFFAEFNRNDVADDTALRFRAEFDRVYDQAMALPGVRDLHHRCCAQLVERFAERNGSAPQDDPRWQHHMALAQG